MQGGRRNASTNSAGGRQPKSRPLICRSNIREALAWLGWFVGSRQRSAWREKDAERKWSTRNTRGMVDGGSGRPRKANDTSLGNFNFAEITVGLIRIKRSLVAVSSASRVEIYIVSHQRHYELCYALVAEPPDDRCSQHARLPPSSTLYPMEPKSRPSFTFLYWLLFLLIPFWRPETLSRKNINQNPLTHHVYWFIHAPRRIRFRDHPPNSLGVTSRTQSPL